MSSSIRRRLLLWLTPILLLTGIGAAALTRFNVQEEIDELFDKVLRTMAYSLPNSAAPVQRSPPRQSLPPKLSDLDLISQIWSPEGHLRYRSHPFPALPHANIEGWNTVEWRGEVWRVFSLKTAVGLIQIAQSQNERRETADEIAIDLLLPLLVLVPGLPLLIWFAIGRGLRPLKDITRSVEKRSPDSLEPIPDHALPDEIASLVSALNGLLQRLGEALATQRKFTADAAHELRTPLTALSLQAQVTEGARNPEKKALALQALRGGIARANHLVEQLLT
ncbi:MAG: histidine kinase dimerization/phospho-acceptor domain-containing protein, partial [Blastocatellia bacterium]